MSRAVPQSTNSHHRSNTGLFAVGSVPMFVGKRQQSFAPGVMNFRRRGGSNSRLEEMGMEESPERPMVQAGNQRMQLPDLKAFNNLHQFELSASLMLGKENPGWRHLSSFADDGLAYKANLTAFSFIRFVPKALTPVAFVDASVNMVGQKVASPFFIAPVGDLGLYHQDAELNQVRAAAHAGIPLCLASKTTKPLKEIFAERDKLASTGAGNCVLWYQVYMLADRALTKTLIKEAVAGGVAAIVVTVDCPVLGNREISPDNANKQMVMSSRDGASPFLDADATWKDVKFARKYSGTAKLLLKGILSVEDAVRARDEGADGVILSNHGGLQLDHVPPALAVLVQLKLQAPELLADPKFEVYIDGGIRRGTDVIKALCLGAKGVGVGRPAIFALCCYGPRGVIKLCDILKDEVDRALRLVGVPKAQDLNSHRIELLDGLLGKRL